MAKNIRKYFFAALLGLFAAGGVVGQTFEWIGGNGNSDWTDAANWDVISGSLPGTGPGAGDSVTILDTAAPDWPMLSDDLSLTDLTIESIASLDMGNKSLTVSGNITNDGTIQNIGALVLNGGGAGTQTIALGTATTPSLTKSGAKPASLISGLTVTTVDIGGGGLSAPSLSVTGTSTISANVTTTGAAGQKYDGTVTLGAGVILDSSAGNGPITFGSTLNSDGTARSMELKAGTGTIAFDGEVGGNEPLNDLTITSGTVAAGGTEDIKINGNLTIGAGAVLNGGSRTISVGGGWTKTGTFTAESSTVIFTGAGATHEIRGSNTFNVFTCTVAGSTLAFEANETQAAATCTITGTSANRITLKRIGIATERWRLAAGSAPSITYCDISDGNSTVYIGWTSGDPSHNNAEGTVNTTSNFFTGFTWATGATDTSWILNSNWDGGIAPPLVSNTTVITIPPGAPFYPALAAPVTVDKVTIAAAASLDLADQDFTAAEVDNSGLLMLHGVTAQNISVTTKTNRSGSTVEYHGTGAAEDKYGGSTYQTLRINKTGGSWATSSAITAVVVNDTSTGGTTITLSHGITGITASPSVLFAVPVTLDAVAVTITSTGGSITMGTVEADTAGTQGLTLNSGSGGTVALNGTIGNTEALASLTVTGATTINTGSIKTTGDQTYKSAVALGTLSLDSSSGGISGAEAFTGTSLTVTAKTGISLSAANNVDTVTLNNNVSGATGNIIYNSSRGSLYTLNVQADNQASGGNVTITEATGDLVVGTGGITTAGNNTTSLELTAAAGSITTTAGGPISGSGGVAKFTSANNKHITINDEIRDFAQLVINAGDPAANTSNGNVAINAGITVTGNDNGERDNAAVYIWANNITTTGTPVTTTGADANVDIYYDTQPPAPAFLSRIDTADKRTCHLHPRSNKHIVYGALGSSPPPPISVTDGTIPNTEFYYYNSDLDWGTGITYYSYNSGTGRNIYIVNVGDANTYSTARKVTFTGSDGGFIEIQGVYKSSGLLTLNPGTGGVRLNAATITLEPNPFNIANSYKNVTLYGNSSIAASGITLGGTVTGSGDLVNNLTLSSTGAISVTGNMGSSPTARLGNIQIATAVGAVFSGSVWANSFTQATGTGTTRFDAAQNYYGVNSANYAFQFDGSASLTMAALTTSATANLGAGGAVIINNTAAFIQSGGIITSGGTFNQAGSGMVSLNGSIITNNGSVANEKITINGAVTLAVNVAITSNNGGDIVFNSTINGYNDLTLTNGTGKVEFYDAVGGGTRLRTITKNGAGATDIHANVSTNNASMTFSGPVNLLDTNVHFDSNTGGGNIRIDGSIDGNDGTPRTITFTAGTGHIYVGGDTGSSALGRTGAIVINSASNVRFGSSASNIVYAASFLQSDGTGAAATAPWIVSGTEFAAAQDYTEGFSFTGNRLTVNNTLETDTDMPDGDGAILITNASNNVNFTVNSPNGSILPGGSGGTILVDGDTINNGAITAANITSGTTSVNGVNYYKVIDFNGNYISAAAGMLNGASSITDDQLIVFRGDAAIGKFTHNGDTVQFSGTNHDVSQAGTDPPVLADVVIDASNIVTVISGTIVQDPAGTGRTLTLTGNAALVLHTTTTDGSWFVGLPSPLPSSWPSWFMLSNPSNNASPVVVSDTNYINNGPEFTKGFAGFNGTLVMENGASLSTQDFYTQMTDTGIHEFILTAPSGASEMCNISASGNVTINQTFTDVSNSLSPLTSTLTMTGNGKELAVRSHPSGTPSSPRIVDVDLGYFIAGAAGTDGTIINSNVIIKGNVTVTPGKILSGGTSSNPSNHIRVEGNWKNDDNSTPSLPTDDGVFIPRQSIVEFGAHTSSGRVFDIIGNTTFYELACFEPLAKIQFSRFPHTHTVTHKLTAFPSDAPYPGNNIGNASNMLTFSRWDDTPSPGLGLVPSPDGGQPYIPPDTPHEHFWYFDLAPGSELELNWATIYYSFSTKRLPTPIDDDGSGGWRVDAFPYQLVVDTTTTPVTVNPNLGTPGTPQGSYYNVNWYAPNQFYYAFSEDTDGNGRIDRLRLQSPFEVMAVWPANSKFPLGTNAFEGFEVAVDGYEIDRTKGYRGYARADWDGSTHTQDADKLDSIFVYLVEKDYTDGGARLRWTLISNKHLYDLTTRSILVGEPEDKDSSGLSWDTVPPRINYALTLPDTPDKQEIYFQMSEPVDGIGVASVDSRTPGQVLPLDPSGSGASQFTFSLDNPYLITDLEGAAPPNFTLKNTAGNIVVDLADDAVDRHYDYNADPYAYQYPSPKYPVDYKYSRYVFARDRLHTPPSGTPWVDKPIEIPNVLDHPFDSSEYPFGRHTHRVTDVLISVPPKDGLDERYFVWPIWAKYKVDANAGNTNPGDDFWRGEKLTDTGIIWQFNGKKYLEAEDIDLQVKRNPSLPTIIPEIRFGINVPDSYRARAISGGYGHGNPGLLLPADLSPPSPPPFVNLVPSFFSSLFRIHDPLLSAGDNYVYRFTKSDYTSPTMLDFFFHLNGSPSDLFVARLDINPGAPIPDNWYRLVRPFSFEIHDITRQRSGVTILNNVINPNNGESTYVHYQLVKGGQVTIQVFTLDGTMVDILYRGHRDSGEYRAVWGGKNRGGRAVARGMYFIRVVGPDIDEIRKVMVIK